jgi:tricarballylate dehydrogenase
MPKKKVIVVGSGNSALCAGIAALEEGAEVIILEKAVPEEAGGNSRYTAGAMRFVYESGDELLLLLSDAQAQESAVDYWPVCSVTMARIELDNG